MGRIGTARFFILTTESDGTDRKGHWLDKWGKPTATVVRNLVAKRPGVKPRRVRVVEASLDVANPVTLVDITF